MDVVPVPIRVPGGTAVAVPLRVGQTLRISNVEGKQVADFIAYCSDNFLQALRSYGIQRHQLPQPVNFFQHMEYGPGGEVNFRESLAKPGDAVELTALMDAIVAVSACPMDLNPISGFRVRDIELGVR